MAENINSSIEGRYEPRRSKVIGHDLVTSFFLKILSVECIIFLFSETIDFELRILREKITSQLARSCS